MSNASEVKLSKETIDTLKSLYAINQTLKIVKDNPEIRTLNQTSTCACITTIAESFPRTFCIYDLREFISVLSIIENPIIDLSNDKYAIVKSEDGRQKLRYVDGNENLINSYFDRNFTLPSEDIEVSVTGGQLKAVMNAAQTLKLEYVGFKSDGEKVFLSAFDRNNGSGEETNGFSIEVAESSDTFDMFYKTEALTILDGDCKFEISSKGISKITNGKKVFWLALDSNSKFG